MNKNLAALEETISKKAREDAIRDVGKLFTNLEHDLYHLMGSKKEYVDLDLAPVQAKAVDLVAREKALLLAEQILRKNVDKEVLE